MHDHRDDAFPQHVSAQERLIAIERDVKYLREVVEALVKGMTSAQQAPGFQGMMARQMIPDLTEVVQP